MTINYVEFMVRVDFASSGSIIHTDYAVWSDLSAPIYATPLIMLLGSWIFMPEVIHRL
jgi:hypothetical protein